MKTKKEQIIEFLKKNGRNSTSRIGVEISCNFWVAEKYLNNLLEKELVIKIEENNATYWELKK